MDSVVLDDGHTGGLCAVVAVFLHKGLAVAVVDLNDDREDTRDNGLDEVYVPLLESLSHNSVVCIGEGVCNDVPSLIPAVAAVIEENSHKFGDSEGGVGIVDVYSYLVSEVFKSTVNVHMSVHDVTDRSRAEEILLAETEALALVVVIVGVEYLGYSVCDRVLSECLIVLALVEHLHIEVWSLSGPESENRHTVAAVACNVHIIGSSHNCVVVDVGDVVVLVVPVFLKVALEVNVDSELGLGNEPYRTAGEPVIGELCLPAVLELLLEDAVFIADRVSHSREACCSETVEVAGCETSETAVSETCIGLVLIYLIEVYIVLLEHSLNVICELKVVETCFEGASHKELH